MPKRAAEDPPSGLTGRQDAGSGLKSRSGRVVKPKVYNDGTVALLSAKAMDDALNDTHSPDATDDCISDRGAPRSNDQGADSDDPASSDVSYGSRGGRVASISRADSGRPVRRSAARAPRPAPATATGGGIFKAAAVEVLRQERRLMATGEIARLALKRGLIRCSGKTPEATMASALYTDVKRREEFSVFFRPQEGLFGLREWAQEDSHAVDATAGGRDGHAAAAAAAAVAHALKAADDAAAAAAVRVSANTDAADRLMELLCAAEEINKAESSLDGADADARVKQEGSDVDEVDQEAGGIALGCMDRSRSTNTPLAQPNAHATFSPSAPRPAACSISAFVANEAVAAAQAAVRNLEQEHGADSMDLAAAYLTLARVCTADMPQEALLNAGAMLQSVVQGVADCQQALECNAPAAVLADLATRMQTLVAPAECDPTSRVFQLHAALAESAGHAAAVMDAAAQSVSQLETALSATPACPTQVAAPVAPAAAGEDQAPATSAKLHTGCGALPLNAECPVTAPPAPVTAAMPAPRAGVASPSLHGAPGAGPEGLLVPLSVPRPALHA